MVVNVDVNTVRPAALPPARHEQQQEGRTTQLPLTGGATASTRAP